MQGENRPCRCRRPSLKSVVVAVVSGHIGDVVGRDRVVVLFVIENVVVQIDVGVIFVLDLDVVIENPDRSSFVTASFTDFLSALSATRLRPDFPVSISTVSPV